MDNYQDPFAEISEHNVSDNVPFLQPVDENEEEIFIFPEEVEVTIKEHDAHLIPTLTLENIKDQVRIMLEKSPSEYELYGNRRYEARTLNEKNCENSAIWGQKGLFAVSDIPSFSVIGIYAGRYLREIEDFEAEYDQNHPVLVDRYMHACDLKGKPAISAYKHGNFMSYINDWRPIDFEKRDDLEELKKDRHNVISAIGNSDEHKFVFYVTIEPVWTGEEFLTDYGLGYWDREKYIRDSILNMK